MMENKLINKFNDIGLNYKKEIFKISISNLSIIIISVICFFLLKNWIVLIIGLVVCIAITCLFISSYNNKKKQLTKEHEKEFLTVITYFQIFINNNINVYKCFEKIIPYCSEWMNEKISTLLRQIDDDKTVQPYINFAKNFNNSMSNNVMLLIYQMVDEGNNKHYMMQFTLLFEQINKNTHLNMIDEKDKSLSNLTVFPLIGSGLITILVIFGVLAIIQEMLYVI